MDNDPEHPQWNTINWKMFLVHTPLGDSEPKTTSLHCGSGCIVPDMKWRQYQTNCIITDAPGSDFHNTIVGESAAENVGVIHKLSIGLNGPKGSDFYMRQNRNSTDY